MKKQQGSSLTELLIVVAIILIIAAIAIPNLLKARMAANESWAAGAIRTINTAQVSYATFFPATGYSGNLNFLGGPAAACVPPALSLVAQACLIDELLSGFGPVPFVTRRYTFPFVPALVVFPSLVTYFVSPKPVTLVTSRQTIHCSDPSHRFPPHLP